MNNWLFVLNNRHAAASVVERRRTGFKLTARGAERLVAGDRFAMYLTRSSFGNRRPAPLIMAIGSVRTKVLDREIEILGTRFPRSCRLAIAEAVDPTYGLPFITLLNDLALTHSREAWRFSLFRSLVELSNSDFELIARSFRDHVDQAGPFTRLY